MNLKILFIENIPWLQRVDEYKLVDSKEMTQIDEYNRLNEENYKRYFFELSISHYLKLSCLFCTLSDEESWGSIYIDEVGLESSILKILKSITCRDNLQMENIFSCLCQRLEKRKFSLCFPILHVACKVVESRQILLFITIHGFWCGFFSFFTNFSHIQTLHTFLSLIYCINFHVRNWPII